MYLYRYNNNNDSSNDNKPMISEPPTPTRAQDYRFRHMQDTRSTSLLNSRCQGRGFLHHRYVMTIITSIILW